MVNKVILVGNLTRDPDLRMTSNGVNVATFSLAINRPFANAQGEREADFINCVVWRKQAENLAKYCGKGSSIAVEGRLQTRTYEANDGSKRYITEVVCDMVHFLQTRRNDNQTMSAPQNHNTKPQTNEDPFASMQDPFASSGSIDLTDDYLPF